MILFILFFSLCAQAETVVVTATRSEASTRSLPYSLGVVSSDSWQGSGESVENSLSIIPGLAFTSAGGPGQTRSVLLRGAKAEHTLVIVDGMVMNDPLSPSRTFDFGQIPLSEIERVEIIKGPQSVLYGSDALGGVVQIFTKKGAHPPKARIEAGSYQSGKAQASYLGFHGAYEKSKGFSAADEREGNSERDGIVAWRLGGKKDFSLSDSLSLAVQADYEDSRTDTDANGGPAADTFNTYTNHQQLLFRADSVYLHREGVEFSTGASVVTHERDDNTISPAFYKAYLTKLEQLVRLTQSGHQTTVGLEACQESGQSNELVHRRSFQGGAIFLQEQFGRRLHGTAGARLDLRSQHKAEPNFRGGLGYWLVPDFFRVKGSLGTGFKAPSLYQTYSRYGTPGLRAEKSLGGDLGLELSSEEWDSELTGYFNRFRDMIDFDSVRSRYFNLRAAKTYGLEWSLARKFRSVTFRNALTTLHSEDRDTGLKLYRRPVFSNTISTEFHEGELRGASLQLRYVGRRDDVHPTLFNRQKMPPFAVVSANAFQRLSQEYKLFLRGENLANRHYQETSGYGVPELSGYAGIEAAW
ncbi:MAG: TonB-dependent receptor plug domain-containing protein [Bacteriovoracia bacterium]